jgi:hypothetical protein
MRKTIFVSVVLAAALLIGIAAIGIVATAERRSEPERLPVLGPTLFAATAPAAPAEPPAPVIPPELALKQVVQLNQNAFIPPQCYTKTKDAAGGVHNPCFVCHVASREPNYTDDGDVQLEYSFVASALTNPWKNLFVDWTPLVAGVSDEEILSYVQRSNYFDADGAITLARVLAELPEAWDWDGDRRWDGFVPDAHFRFDEHGFDRGADGRYSGWRALAYYPLPGTFWPTNGSIGDVLVRLPNAFRERESGEADVGIYRLNLAILQALISRRDVAIERTREAELGIDLDGDGRLAVADRIKFVAAGPEPHGMSFVGRARREQAEGRVQLAEGLFPVGTEFLHSVRYLEPTAGGVTLAARLKELRYARKAEWWSYQQLDKRARVEAIEKTDSPAERRALGGDIERGMSNGQGWWYQGFIEDARGDLRPQTFEETGYCVGCHGGVGATDDGIFSFGRMLGPEAFQGGWYHWSQRDLKGVPDRRIHGTHTEYVTYLAQNGAGDEFRQNAEVSALFFDAKGRLRPREAQKLAHDVTRVLAPSRERALALNKAYRALVERQSFRLGRDLVLDGAKNVHTALDPGERTGVAVPVAPGWSPTPTMPARAAD